MQIDGHCHCGRIRYTAEIDPAKVTICHCTDCQILTGTAFRVSVSTRREQLHIDGETAIYVKHAQSGRLRHLHFCPSCGSPLFSTGTGDAAGVWGIRWGGIRQREALTPTTQIWRRSAPSWICAFEDMAARPGE